MSIWKRLASAFKKKRKMRFLVLGLDNAGKSAVINSLKREQVHTGPTVGYSSEKFEYGGVHFNAFDMSGQSKYRDMWEHHFEDCEVGS